MIIYTVDKPPVAFQIDEEDYDRVSTYRWHLYHKYLQTRQGPRCFLHQFIMGHAPGRLEWDHKDHDKLNNKKDNLQLVTSGQNKRNNPGWARSGHKGVIVHTKGFFAYINRPGKQIRLGFFSTIEEAVLAREIAEKEYPK